MNHLLMFWSKADQLCVQQGSCDSMKLANSNHLDRLKPTVCTLSHGNGGVTNPLPRTEASPVSDSAGHICRKQPERPGILAKPQKSACLGHELQVTVSISPCAVWFCAAWQAGCAWGSPLKHKCSCYFVSGLEWASQKIRVPDKTIASRQHIP